MKCFLDDVEQVIKNSQDYYSPFKNKPSTRERELTSPWECYKKGHAEIVDMLDRGRRVQVIDGKVWTRCEVKASWCDGQYFNATHPYCEDVYNYDRAKPWRRHAHTSFFFAGHDFHVDYIMWRTYGPLMGFEECRVFVDGEWKARGGYFAGLGCAIHIKYPVAVVAPDFALILKKGPDINKDFVAWTIRPC